MLDFLIVKLQQAPTHIQKCKDIHHFCRGHQHNIDQRNTIGEILQDSDQQRQYSKQDQRNRYTPAQPFVMLYDNAQLQQYRNFRKCKIQEYPFATLIQIVLINGIIESGINGYNHHHHPRDHKPRRDLQTQRDLFQPAFIYIQIFQIKVENQCLHKLQDINQEIRDTNHPISGHAHIPPVNIGVTLYITCLLVLFTYSAT